MDPRVRFIPRKHHPVLRSKSSAAQLGSLDEEARAESMTLERRTEIAKAAVTKQ